LLICGCAYRASVMGVSATAVHVTAAGADS
jgi:hypothetical protein